MASSTLLDPSCAEQVGGVAVKKPTAVDANGGILCHICQAIHSNKKDYDLHYAQHNVAGGSIVYTCVVCLKGKSTYASFRNHCYLTHIVKNKYKCLHCSKKFCKLSIMNGHIDTVHNLKFKCKLCSEEFTSKKELQMHEGIHKNQKYKSYQCLLADCSAIIDSQDMCELHIDEHCIISYPCPICNEISPNKMDAAKHLTKHFDEKQPNKVITNKPQMGEDSSIDVLGGILCCFCDELFKNRREFDTHFSQEHQDKELLYSCNICCKQYEKYHLFANHCYFHLAKDRFLCTDCGKTFPRLSLLVVHTEAFHSAGGGSPDKPYRCAACGRGFSTVRRLRDHARAVHAATSVPCAEPGCDMTFQSPKDLIFHQRSHKSSCDNCCRHCGMLLTTLSAAELHLDVHRRKQYSCPVCNRDYKEKYLLLKHIPQHFESVLHCCKVCGKVFNARHRFVEHSKTHSDLRSHTCSYCGKGFMRPFQLEQHLNIHTGQKPFKCIVCPKTFASYPNLRKHLRRMHNIDKKDGKKSETAKPETIPNTVTENVDRKMKIESGIDSTSSEISMEMNSMAESDDSTMDSVDPIVIEKDWSIMNENMVDSGLEYTDMLPVNDAFDSATLDNSTITDLSQTVGYPPEYGPDFGTETRDLDDHYLPHIDPLLTFKNEQAAQKMFVNAFDTYAYDQATPIDVNQANWEPLITKVYQAFEENDVSRLSIMNTDIF